MRKGTPAELRRDLYFFFMEGGWSRLFGTLGFVYLISNVFFAALYMLEPGSIGGGGEDASESFLTAFMFSVQTMSTIGYGVLHPTSNYGDLLVTIEAAFGIFGVAISTGLMFAKASRPKASVLFSENMILTTRHGRRTLMFRAGNARGNAVVDAQMTVSALMDEVSPEGHHMRRVHDLKLVRERSPIFSLSWTVMHEIDDDSPLTDIDWSDPGEHVLSIVCTLLGHDATYGQTTHARHLYMPEDIVPNARFVDVISELEDGRLMMDYTKFHDVIDESGQTEEAGSEEPGSD